MYLLQQQRLLPSPHLPRWYRSARQYNQGEDLRAVCTTARHAEDLQQQRIRQERWLRSMQHTMRFDRNQLAYIQHSNAATAHPVLLLRALLPPLLLPLP
jgi:hypothetical protein